MQQTVVINVVGLSGNLLGKNTPNLLALAREGVHSPIQTVTPAVTCTVQSTFLTGLLPSGHGIVGNGWYFRDLAQVWLWRQSNHLVTGEKVWESARRREPSFTCAKMFWWFNMYSSADFSVTLLPIYTADGRKIPDIYSFPPGLSEKLKSEIGNFPFFNFWGPNANILSSEWIAEASLRVFEWQSPDLTMIYLPHLDYNLQRLGPAHPQISQDLRQIDQICGKLINHCRAKGARVIVVSEYAMTPVDGAVHINRALREAGLLQIRNELDLEVLDAGASRAFAVADHQVAHVYVRDPRKVAEVKKFLERVGGIEQILDQNGKAGLGLDHPRSGELVAIAQPNKWFSYYYWIDDKLAPDFARTVDIHRKPGYDPLELFINPEIRFPKVKIAKTVLKKRLGFRYLLDVIPLDTTLVKGSHGRVSDDLSEAPVFISSERETLRKPVVHATEVKGLILNHLFAE